MPWQWSDDHPRSENQCNSPGCKDQQLGQPCQNVICLFHDCSSVTSCAPRTTRHPCGHFSHRPVWGGHFNDFARAQAERKILILLQLRSTGEQGEATTSCGGPLGSRPQYMVHIDRACAMRAARLHRQAPDCTHRGGHWPPRRWANSHSNIGSYVYAHL